MTAPTEKKRNMWVLPGLVLWGFLPAILIATSILSGWKSGDIGAAIPLQDVQRFQQSVGILGMPFILWGWSAVVLARSGMGPLKAVGLGIPLALVMCVVNIFAGISGCSMLSSIVPKEGIF